MTTALIIGDIKRGITGAFPFAATCYDAADRGHRITVLRDGCADSDPSVHEIFMDRVFPGRGFEVLPCAGWPAARRGDR